ncbi:hypothetical protein J2Z21_007898 [Streptomyces griseochromogenes]|uniref:Uncharacterized protein n=2 Tax=Streptomyces griseochromogenes TaxID=68214 RepID=A0ABS4M5I5_9ACTN|nr:hypothetical protein [Streptomyces griseochromogenes]MBP2054888.1 hypothetical protein [Streptomyces griseochromogenes]
MAGTALMAVMAVGGCSGTSGPENGDSAKKPAPSGFSGTEPSIPPLVPAAGGDPSKPVDFKGGGAVVRPDGSMTLPLDAYVSMKDERTIIRAENVLAQQCMRDKGLKLPEALMLDNGPEPPAPYVIYGVMDMKAVKVYGYREPSPEPKPASGRAVDDDITPAVKRAYFDDPKSGRLGCAGKARRKLGGKNPETLFMVVQQLRSQTLSATFQDSRVVATVSTWSACMKKSGYNYDNPLAPAHDRSLLGKGLPVPKGATLPPPSPAEIAAAVTDVECKRKAQYVQTAALISAAYEREIIKQRAKQLQDARRTQKLKVESAEKIIKTGA